MDVFFKTHFLLIEKNAEDGKCSIQFVPDKIFTKSDVINTKCMTIKERLKYTLCHIAYTYVRNFFSLSLSLTESGVINANCLVYMAIKAVVWTFETSTKKSGFNW